MYMVNSMKNLKKLEVIDLQGINISDWKNEGKEIRMALRQIRELKLNGYEYRNFCGIIKLDL